MRVTMDSQKLGARFLSLQGLLTSGGCLLTISMPARHAASMDAWPRRGLVIGPGLARTRRRRCPPLRATILRTFLLFIASVMKICRDLPGFASIYSRFSARAFIYRLRQDTCVKGSSENNSLALRSDMKATAIRLSRIAALSSPLPSKATHKRAPILKRR